MAADIRGGFVTINLTSRPRPTQAIAKGRAAATPEPAEYDLGAAARNVVATVSEHRAVWGTHHLEAEARRWVTAQGTGTGLPADAVEQITRRAVRDESITLTPPPAHGTFQPLTRTDGQSIYADKGRTVHTSRTVLAAEDLLLAAARERTISPVAPAVFDRVMAEHGAGLDAGQRALAAEFACSPTHLVLGSGPAGTGKTTALKVAARAVEAQGGRMLGVAPSAVAAAVMRDALGIPAITIDKLLVGKGSFDELVQRTDVPENTGLRAGDVLVVDEVGMAGTVKFAKLARLTKLAGAHIRGTGDDRQLGAPEAGGALRLVEREVGVVHLETIHRFADPAEAAASILLRDPAVAGDPFAWYLQEGRAVGGGRDRMVEAVFGAWQADTNAGRESLMLAQQNTCGTGPILVLILAIIGRRPTDATGSILLGGVVVLITFGCAALSYRWVENPIRVLGFRGYLRTFGVTLRRGTVPRRIAAVLAPLLGVVLVFGTAGAVQSAPNTTTAERAIERGQAALSNPSSPTAPTTSPPTSTPATTPIAPPTPPPATTPASETPPVVPAGTDISAIGDSVMLASAPELQTVFPGISIDAVVSRQTTQGPAIIQAMADAGTLRPYVVVGLGTNGDCRDDYFQQIIDIAGPTRHVIFINIAGPMDWTGTVNGRLQRIQTESPGVRIADWAGTITGHTDLLASDGIHPGPSGAALYADALRAALSNPAVQ